MSSFVDTIRTKRDGGALDAEQLAAFISGVSDGSLPDYQVAAMLMAIFQRGMTKAEKVALTLGMRDSGAVMDWSALEGVPVDKHSTGGVGDKVSLPLAPLVAACGVPVPMISGRGLGHSGGTLDKLESIPGFRTDLSLDRFRELVGTLGCGLIGQTADIAPADKRLYALRDVTATVECIPLIVASILSKKLAEGIDGLVLDVKWGTGAFMRTYEDATALAHALVDVGRGAGKQVVARLTDMNQPLGQAVGNALEVRESIATLRGEGPADTREITLELAAEMLVLGRACDTLDAARERAAAALDSGAALARFREIVEAQHGDPRVVDDPSRLPSAPEVRTVVAERRGYLGAVECAEIGRAAVMLGAGRKRVDCVIDPAVGLEVLVAIGDEVEPGQPLARVHTRDGAPTDAAVARFLGALTFTDAPCEAPSLFRERIAH